jgi:hypothetical protein
VKSAVIIQTICEGREPERTPPTVSALMDGEGVYDGVPFTAEALRAACATDGVECIFNTDESEAIVAGAWQIEVDESYPEVDDVSSWIYDVSESELESWGLDTADFSVTFWEWPALLYHATQDDNVEAIQAEGIGAMNKTRGLTNRGIGSAVFTSSEPEELAHGSYGDNIFQIDTGAMKADGYTPRVSQEPDVEEYEWRRRLLHKVGADRVADYLELSSDMSPSTVIVHGAIPAKYLTLT